MGKKSDKPPKFELVDKRDDAYALLAELVPNFHAEIADANIALAWMNGVKADRDGHVLWGRAKKVGPLERQFHENDFVICLNKIVWNTLPLIARRALIDHELSHCGSETDEKTGEVTYVTKRHDVEEFVPIVRRYGLWKEDVKALVNAALKREQAGLFPGVSETTTDGAAAAAQDFRDAIESIPGVEKVTLSMGDKTVTLKGGAK